MDLLPHHDNLPATGYNFNNADLLLRLRRASSLLEGVLSQAVAAAAGEDEEGESSSLSSSLPPPLATAATATTATAAVEEASPSLLPALPPFLHLTMDPEALRGIEDGQPPVPVWVVNSLGWPR